MDWNEVQACFDLTQRNWRDEIPRDFHIRIRHPGYTGFKSILFTFYAYDHERGGIRKSLALTACGLISNNTWDGYFSREVSGPPVTEDLNDVLIGDDFFFHNHPPSTSCSCIEEPYPVYPEFAVWPFPHGKLPHWWPSTPSPAPTVTISDASSAVKARDATCRITGSAENGETAHIIPVKESAWFQMNDMVFYSTDLPSINSTGNQMLLRRDIHDAHEGFQWVVFPKGQKWAYYALDGSFELAAQFHQREVRPLLGIKSEYLLAAFARAIFPMLGPFLRSGVDRWLLGVKIESQNSNTGFKVDGEYCAERFALPGRQPSPNKRKSPSKQDSPRKKGCEPLVAPILLEEVPCTCPILRRSSSVSSNSDNSQNEDPMITTQSWKVCMSSQCRNRAEFKHINQLRHEHLKSERLRSNPSGTWERHLEWMEDDPSAVRQPKRFFWVCGQDIFGPKDEEHFDF
ncbi:MAG: hypothetical protein L6R41_000926 [Letrouitia leprolyta]|nr:MAG: hypothetical protein L6R41_000926 [Letrouitia leprolyta]